MKGGLPFRRRPSYVIGVSWPRSGHHLLARLLRLYFGPTFTYCGFYGQAGCCGKAPCARAGEIRYSKNHDFDGTLPQDPSRRYLIQTRAFAPSVVSNFELYLREGGRDDAQSFARFASAQFAAYRAFQGKWVTSAFGRAQTVIPYEALIRDPARALSAALDAFGETPPDMARVQAAIARVDGEEVAHRRIRPRPGTGVHAPRDVTQFRHYDARVFGYLDKLRLTRQEVMDVFRRHLDRDAAEDNMLALQTNPSVAEVERMILGSPEYAARGRKLRAV
ncbi:hypothetical protein [Marivita hallyeonensis]|uniref:Sulfotransferase family protein n=1 Tax=Marivita hallyeonensis TaxID=996342 RepID=A0A1M5Y5M2_9RHOB|nr:hypothetical protein [Marivita hallyeonensis]SHI07370.1 hypothetical protein SAMN05443551_0097 [Marivita hallyeonensis]